MPELVGRYEIRERVGEGAMADVYRAWDPHIQRELAIKVLKPEFRARREYAGRFLREAKAAGALSHPNIVTIYDVGEAGGFPYIAMELLDGQPLDAAVQGQRLELETVLAVGVQLAEALRYAHGAGVVHRDIKPSNIMLGRDGRSVKILDFGIARVAEALGRAELEGGRTQVGQVLGTPRYMSPEQALGQEIDGRSDLFSAGVVLYELLTGKKAFAGASAATLALQITQAEPAALGEVAPETPRGLQFIVTKLMAKRPERRFADGGQLAEALRREQAALAAATLEGRSRRRIPMAVRTSLVMVGVTGAVLAVAVGAVLGREGAAMRRMTLTSGEAVSSFVASNAALRAADNATLPPDQRDWAPVDAFVRAASADPNVRALKVVDRDGVIRGATDPALVGRPYRAAAGEAEVRTAPELRVTAEGARGADGFRFVRPITYAGQRFGTVDVSLSNGELNAAARDSRLMLILLSAVVLMAVGAGSYAVAREAAGPVRRLKAALADAAMGDLDFRISHRRRDEFGELFDGVNTLLAGLQERLYAAEGRSLDGTVVQPVPAAHAVAEASPREGPFAAPEPAPRAAAPRLKALTA